MDISGTKYILMFFLFYIFFKSFDSPSSVFSVFLFSLLHRHKPYVIRSPRRRLAVEVQLQNRLENAYNTSLTMHYSRNLHFSSLSIRVGDAPATLAHVEAAHTSSHTSLLFQEDPNFKIECTAIGANSHSCNVSYPVFRSQSKVRTFKNKIQK